MTDDVEQKRQDLNRRLIDKIANDPAFREQLAANPEAAIAGSEFKDALQELSEAGREVSGYEAADSYCCIISALY